MHAVLGSATTIRMRGITGVLAQSASYSSVPRQMTQQMTLKEIGIMGRRSHGTDFSWRVCFFSTSGLIRQTDADLLLTIDPYVIPEKENRPSLFSDYKKWIKYAKLRMRNTGMTAARYDILAMEIRSGIRQDSM